MAADLSIVVKLVDKASKGLATIKGKAAALGGALKKAAMVGAAGIAVLGVAAVKFGMDFDEAFNIIRVGTGATGDALEGLKKDFKATLKDVPDDMEKVAQATADLNTRLGLTGKPLQTLSKRFLELSRITKTDVTTNIRLGTRVLGDWDIATEDAADTLDFLFKVSQTTGISLEKLQTSIVSYGAPMRQFGFSFEKAAVLMGKWEKEGVNTEAIMAGLKIGVANLAKAGIPLAQGLEDIIAELTALGPGAEATGRAIEVFGSRAGPDMAAAITEGRFALDDLTAAIEDSDETIAQAAEDTLTLTDKLKILKNKALVALEPVLTRIVSALERFVGFVADELGPRVGPLVKDLKEWAEINLAEPVQDLADAGANVYKVVKDIVKTAVLPALNRLAKDLGPVIAKAAEKIGELFLTMSKNEGVVRAATISMATFAAVFVAFKTGAFIQEMAGAVAAIFAMSVSAGAGTAALHALKAALVTTGIGAIFIALGIAVLLLITHWDEIVAFWNKTFMPILKKVGDAIGGFVDDVVGFFRRLRDDPIGVLRDFKNLLVGHWKEIVQVALLILFPPAGGLFFIITHFTEIKDKVLGIVKSIPGLLREHWRKIVMIALAILFPPGAGLFALVTNAGGVRDKVVDIIKGIPGQLGKLATAFYNAAKSLGKQLIEGLKSGIGSVFGLAQDIASTVANAIKGLINTQIIDKINRALEFTVKGPFGMGSVKINPPDIPRLHKGGRILSSGLAEVEEGEVYSKGGAPINITLIHNGPLMGNAAEKQRFVADIGQALRREWRREYA